MKPASGLIKRIALLNMIPNLFWSSLMIAPCFLFCYRNMPLSMIYIFLAISFLTVFVPETFYSSIQLANSTTAYKKLGVKFFNKFTQNGVLVNALIRKKIPNYAVVTTQAMSQKKLLQHINMFGKFHYAAFVFFILTTLYAMSEKYLEWALVISLTNIIYNVYPILLQQYLRLRIISLGKKAKP